MNKRDVFGVGAGLIVLGIGVVMYLTNWSVHTILSSSMEPTLPLGSLVITHAQAPNSYRVGDVVTFITPAHQLVLVTHRITQIIPPQSMEPLTLLTKGDANTNGDAWALSPGNIQGRVVFKIPYVGFLIHAIQTPLGFGALVVATFLGLVVPFVTKRLQSAVE
jgi:signal peptidase